MRRLRSEGAAASVLGRLRGSVGLSSPVVRRMAAMIVDVLIVLESLVIALLFRFDAQVPTNYWASFWWFAVLSTAVFIAFLLESGVYKNVSRYTGVYQGVRVASATALATGVLLIANLGLERLWARPVPLSVLLVGSALAYIQLVAVRLYPRVFYERSLREVGERERALIVGTGEAGVALARQLWRTPDAEMKPVGFVDDTDGRLRGGQIEEMPVLGGIKDIEQLVADQGIDQILIALPEASSEEIDRVWRECVKTEAEVKVVPKLTEFLGRATVQLRELQIQDLLGRQPVEIDLDALAEFVNGKRVLVTGAGGSIGSELSRQISRLGPAQLVLLDRDESALHYLNEELARDGSASAELIVGDVTNMEKVRILFTRLQPQLVFHAAAYKHVPLMELHASEAVSLILQAGAMADSYGTYVLEMGRPVRIVDLATKMIEVMGAKDIEIKFVGLRPGEKLHEMLSEESERRAATAHSMVFRLLSKDPPSSDLLEVAEEISFFARAGDDEKVLNLIRRSVPNYPVVESGSIPEAL